MLAMDMTFLRSIKRTRNEILRGLETQNFLTKLKE
jgi:hypothetical protein